MKYFNQYYFSEADQRRAHATTPSVYDTRHAIKLIEKTFLNNLNQALQHTAQDEKIGVLLSGGVDSSLLVAMLRALTDKEIICFTAMTEDTDTDVLSSKRIAHVFKTKWVKCILKKSDLDSQLARLVPGSKGGLYGTAADMALDICLSKCREYGVTTLWAGNGLDMYFGGGLEPARFKADAPEPFHRSYWKFSFDLLRNRFFEQDGIHLNTLAGCYGVQVMMPFENLDSIITARSIDANLFFQYGEDKYPVRLLAHRYGVPLREARRQKEPLQSSSGIFGLLREYMYETLPDLTNDAVNFRMTKKYFAQNPNTDLQIFLSLLNAIAQH